MVATVTVPEGRSLGTQRYMGPGRPPRAGHLLWETRCRQNENAHHFSLSILSCSWASPDALAVSLLAGASRQGVAHPTWGSGAHVRLRPVFSALSAGLATELSPLPSQAGMPKENKPGSAPVIKQVLRCVNNRVAFPKHSATAVFVLGQTSAPSGRPGTLRGCARVLGPGRPQAAPPAAGLGSRAALGAAAKV